MQIKCILTANSCYEVHNKNFKALFYNTVKLFKSSQLLSNVETTEPTGLLIASNCTTLILGREPAPNRHAIVPFGQSGLEMMVLIGKQIRSKPTKHMYNTTM
jgi:hypothetical protein